MAPEERVKTFGNQKESVAAHPRQTTITQEESRVLGVFFRAPAPIQPPLQETSVPNPAPCISSDIKQQDQNIPLQQDLYQEMADTPGPRLIIAKSDPVEVDTSLERRTMKDSNPVFCDETGESLSETISSPEEDDVRSSNHQGIE